MSIPDLPKNTTLESRSVLITGSNVGLGYSAALLSLQLGASPVYLAVRTLPKGDKAREALLADPVVKEKNPNAVVKVYQLDMSTWDGVTSFASKFIADRKAAGESLDVAMLNAGIMNTAYEVAPTGNEAVIQVNHLSTALLSLLLLPLLESSTIPEHTARLMIVSSGAHAEVKSLKACPPDDYNYLASLNDKKTFTATRDRYGLSKLLIIFFLRELSTRVSSDKVIINNVCPGLIRTEINRGMPSYDRPALEARYAASANPVEKGAACYVHAVAAVGKESHGLWYRRMELTPYADIVTNGEGEKLQPRIWNETMEALDKVVPGIGSDI
ncbi:NAD(P)-binding protein [Calocera viscosa TUFC12733]|uniref:NAD(P)-binding protein n=1 Tax=Calocera viscosa (strain TUFC12733) TaxID=1330018 RepID=A0A167JAS2_CALVF|nr:NAD(P)-binding protein [Calocera viscosa TUFC12733]